MWLIAVTSYTTTQSSSQISSLLHLLHFLLYLCFISLTTTPSNLPSVYCLSRPLGSALICFCPEHQSITSSPACHLSQFQSVHCVTLYLQLVLHLSSYLFPHPFSHQSPVSPPNFLILFHIYLKCSRKSTHFLITFLYVSTMSTFVTSVNESAR